MSASRSDMAKPTIEWAYNVFNKLHGVFCIYKPTEMACHDAMKILTKNILRELNALPNNITERRLLQIAMEHNPDKKPEQLRLEHGVSAWKKEQGIKQIWNNEQKLIHDGKETQAIPSGSSFLPSMSMQRNGSNAGAGHMVTTESEEVDLMDSSRVPARMDVGPITMGDLAATSLVLGPRYSEDDIMLRWADTLDYYSSGVLVVGFGSLAIKKIYALVGQKHLRVYHIKGRLGQATDDHTDLGSVLERSTYHHISLSTIEKVCAAVQSQYQRQMFENADVHPESQEAYELACQGLLRPKSGQSNMVIYGIKCIEFNSPEFTLEVQSVAESTPELNFLVHDLGLKMKSTAVCTSVRRIRYGHFDLSKALVATDEWHTKNLMQNIIDCKEYLKSENLFLGPTLGVKKDIGKQKKILSGGNNMALLREGSDVDKMPAITEDDACGSEESLQAA